MRSHDPECGSNLEGKAAGNVYHRVKSAHHNARTAQPAASMHVHRSAARNHVQLTHHSPWEVGGGWEAGPPKSKSKNREAKNAAKNASIDKTSSAKASPLTTRPITPAYSAHSTFCSTPRVHHRCRPLSSPAPSSSVCRPYQPSPQLTFRPTRHRSQPRPRSSLPRSPAGLRAWRPQLRKFHSKLGRRPQGRYPA